MPSARSRDLIGSHSPRRWLAPTAATFYVGDDHMNPPSHAPRRAAPPMRRGAGALGASLCSHDFLKRIFVYALDLSFGVVSPRILGTTLQCARFITVR